MTVLTRTRQEIDGHPRSLLFVPGDRPERFPKAHASGCDAVIVDLEDSVPPADKPAARANAAAWADAQPCLVRVNAAASKEFSADLQALAAVTSLRGVVVPKAESADDIQTVWDRLGRAVPVLALIESARGLLAAEQVAGHPGVAALAFGNLDFAADCGIDPTAPDEPELLLARSQIVLVSRVHRLQGPVDGVTPDFRDPAAATSDAERARRLGYAAKLCIHPSQVGSVHAAFTPTESQLAWAHRILEADTGGVVTMDGHMVDGPLVRRAKALVDAHDLWPSDRGVEPPP